MGDLAANATATASFVFTNSIIGFMTNTVTLATGSQDTNLTNNTATTVVTVIRQAPKIINAGALLTYESGPVNGAIDPDEQVTLSLALANVGVKDTTTNLTATLQPTGGVTTNQTGPQTAHYAALIAGGPSASGSFTFKAASVFDSAIVVTLVLQDESAGVTNQQVTFTFGAPALTRFTNSAAITIPDHGSGTPYPSAISVSGLTGQVSKATVTLNQLTHTFPRDANVLLVSPAGDTVLLMSHAGAGYAVTNPITLTFDDAVTDTLPANLPLTSGTYHPASYPGGVSFVAPAPSGSYGAVLSAVNGDEPNGDWKLYVLDDAVGDGGLIAGGWSLDLTVVVPINPVADLAVGMSSAPASVLVGGYVTNTISVTNLGPAAATGVVLTETLSSGGQVITNLGTLAAGAGVAVSFTVALPVSGSITNTVAVAGNEVDPNPANNSASRVTSVLSIVPATLSGAVENGQFQLVVSAQPGFTYVILGSTNLTSWQPLSTNTASSSGTIKYTDPAYPSLVHRYYRTLQVTP